MINGVTWLEPAAYAIGFGVAIVCLAAAGQWAKPVSVISVAPARKES